MPPKEIMPAVLAMCSALSAGNYPRLAALAQCVTMRQAASCEMDRQLAECEMARLLREGV